MSPRAAARLEDLGFTMVFDYVAGKLDWLAHDLPFEGELKEKHVLGEMVYRDAPTCAAQESYGSVRQRLKQDSFCIVTNDAGIVLGLLREQADGNNEVKVEEIMELGPTTFRPSTTLGDAADYSRTNDLDPILVTSSDGRLLGVIRRRDLK